MAATGRTTKSDCAHVGCSVGLPTARIAKIGIGHYTRLAEGASVNISGIVVRVQPRDVACVVAELALIPGVVVHYQDLTAGRIVITQETQSTPEQEAAFERIRTLPRVVSAELAYHYCGAGTEETHDLGGGLR